jgi:hypothetical protein
MSLVAWLFLYLAGLMELAMRYRLSLSRGHTAFVILIPLAFLAIAHWQKRKLKPELERALPVLGAVLACGCAITFARNVSLDFWDTERMDMAWLSAGIGIGGLFAVREESSLTQWQFANWLIVSVGWLLALWNPIGPWLAIGPAASLGVWQRAAPVEQSPKNKTIGLSPAWVLFLIGMGMSKSWWDSDTWGALGTGLWAFGVALTYLGRMRSVEQRWPLLWLALFPFLYPWLPIWIWAPLFGLLSGWALQQSARPWHWAAAYALLGGFLLSYGLHSNLQWFDWLVWGTR